MCIFQLSCLCGLCIWHSCHLTQLFNIVCWYNTCYSTLVSIYRDVPVHIRHTPIHNPSVIWAESYLCELSKVCYVVLPISSPGEDCSVNFDECLSNPCRGRGSLCEDLIYGYRCHCSPGLIGPQCSFTDPDACGPVRCHATGGICTWNPLGDYRCTCRTGWTGELYFYIAFYMSICSILYVDVCKSLATGCTSPRIVHKCVISWERFYLLLSQLTRTCVTLNILWGNLRRYISV